MGRRSRSSFPASSWDPFGGVPVAEHLEVGQIDLSIHASWADECFSHYPTFNIVNFVRKGERT